MSKPNETALTEILPVFNDTKLELIRLLKEATEIEHSLLVQYLYAAFSVKSNRYPRLIGRGYRMPGQSTDLLGVAIEEMDHLDTVNRLLVELGAAPNLERQDFPYEHTIYPFPLNLEPLSLQSLAKYIYVEASASAIDPNHNDNQEPKKKKFLRRLYKELGRGCRPNQLGSLYSAILNRLTQLEQESAEALPNIDKWRTRLEKIKGEGETEHFDVFKSIFLGDHEGFRDVDSPWMLEPSDNDYPAYQIPMNPTAFPQGANSIDNSPGRELAWLSDLHYWLVCMLLDFSYRGYDKLHAAAREHMVGPLRQVGFQLPKMGLGIPFDRLSFGYARGKGPEHMKKLILRLLDEIESLEHSLASNLPVGYSPGQTIEQTRKLLYSL